jgi:hypothetical protein
VAFPYTKFYTILSFINQRNYKTLAMHAHTSNHMLNFNSLNIIISHLRVQGKTALSLVYAIILPSSLPPARVFVMVAQAWN